MVGELFKCVDVNDVVVSTTVYHGSDLLRVIFCSNVDVRNPRWCCFYLFFCVLCYVCVVKLCVCFYLV